MTRLSIVLLAFGIVSSVAADLPTPIANWTAPPYWAPQPQGAIHQGWSTPLALPSSPVPFVAVTPCRIADTRTGFGFSGAFGPPALVGSATARTFPIPTSSCASSYAASGIVAWSLNFTVIAPGGAPLGSFLTAFPTGSSQPTVSTLNFGGTGAVQVIANAAVVPAGTNGSISVFVNWGTDLLIDVNGYYAPQTNVVNTLNALSGNVTLAPGANVSITPSGTTLTIAAAPGGLTLPYSGTFESTAASFAVINPWNPPPQRPVEPSSSYLPPVAIAGSAIQGTGLYGEGAEGVQGYATYSLGIGVEGEGGFYGVYGSTSSTYSDAAGVYGRTTWTSGATGLLPAGVRGESNSYYGVFGVSQYAGVIGNVFNSSHVFLAAGALGIVTGGHTYGVYSNGNFGGTGAKFFIEPHPLRADSSIRYVALEGPEAGTYFRGRGRFVGRGAVIEVPEDFRLVTDPEGLTVQVTPIGDIVGVAVVRVGLDRIVLKSTGDVEFFFTVNGVRHTQKDLVPILEDSAFMPEGPDATIPGYLNEAQKHSLVANGTYNEDGTVNLQTAERLGWTRVWREREEVINASAETAERPARPGSGEKRGTP